MYCNKMPKVLVIGQENLTIAGIQNVIMSIVRSFHNQYLFDVVLLRNEKKEYDDEFLSYGGKIFHCPTYQGTNRILKRADFYVRGNKLYRFTRKIIRENGPYQVIHCHASIESAVFLKAAYKEGVPVRLVHSHGVHDMTDENFVRRTLDYIYISSIHKYATKLLGDSEGANKTHYGKADDAIVIPPCYDETRFNPELYDSTQNDRRLMMTQVGQYCANKNQIFTIKVFAEIIKAFPDAQLNFVGFDSSGYLSKMNNEIKTLGIEKNVSFFPQNYDIPLLLSQSDVFMFPSFTEGFGIAVVEAQAMGVRCYASDTVPKTTNCGGCTFLSLNSEPYEWAKKIIEDYQIKPKNVCINCNQYKSSEIRKQYQHLYQGI